MKINNQNGLATLVVVVIIAAVGLLMAYSAVILGLGEIEMGFSSSQAGEAMSIAEGCLDEALFRLKKDNTYAGDSLNLGNGSCIITIAGVGANRTITVFSTLGDYHKKIEAGVTLGVKTVAVDYWKELVN